MKNKIYQKPSIKTVRLFGEKMLSSSGSSDNQLEVGEIKDIVNGGQALSNREGNQDIWGRNGNIWD